MALLHEYQHLALSGPRYGIRTSSFGRENKAAEIGLPVL
jgi:hypothetical protein